MLPAQSWSSVVLGRFRSGARLFPSSFLFLSPLLSASTRRPLPCWCHLIDSGPWFRTPTPAPGLGAPPRTVRVAGLRAKAFSCNIATLSTPLHLRPRACLAGPLHHHWAADSGLTHFCFFAQAQGKGKDSVKAQWARGSSCGIRCHAVAGPSILREP